MKRSFLLMLLAAGVLLSAALAASRSPAGVRETMYAGPAASREPEPEGAFLLAERDGMVAVFSPAGAEEPREITAIRVELLPAADRKELHVGIPAEDPLALAMLLEDLGS